MIQNQQNQQNQNQAAARRMASGPPQGTVNPAMQNMSGMSSMPGGGGQYTGQNANPTSPMSHQSQSQMHAQSSQNAMFPSGSHGQGGNGLDPRTIPPTMQNLAGVNMNNLTPHQRQLLLMQQSRGGGGNSNSMMMTPQQQAYYAQQQQQQQQERMRQDQHQQRLALSQAQQAHSPTHAGSPMSLPGDHGNAFPALRSNSTIPGIARSTRSPSDSAPSPMTPRAPTRGPSMSQEDYSRALLQAQQTQANRLLTAHNQMQQQQQQQQQSNWQHQQQQQAMQMSHGQGSSYGMSPPGSAGMGSYGGNAPSPSNSQNWSQGAYPFAPSPGAHQSDRGGAQTPRHLSATPAPQQHQQQNTSPPTDQSDFDLFNWTTAQ